MNIFCVSEDGAAIKEESEYSCQIKTSHLTTGAIPHALRIEPEKKQLQSWLLSEDKVRLVGFRVINYPLEVVECLPHLPP